MIAVRCQQRRLDLDLAIALNLVLAQRPLRLLCAKCDGRAADIGAAAKRSFQNRKPADNKRTD